MRCAISSSAGQLLAKGYLVIQKDDNEEMRLNFVSDGGRVIQGGIVGADGDLSVASKELFRGFFQAWGLSDVTITANPKM